MTAEVRLKAGYVALAHGAGRVSAGIGLAGWLDRRRSRSVTAHWLRSLTEIHDLEGMISLDVPWWTYRAIAEVDAFLAARAGARVFEYGSGASTVWLARRAGAVDSVEHHPGWHARMQAALAKTEGLAPVDLRLVKADAAPNPDPLYRSGKAGAAGTSFAAYARSVARAPQPLYDLIVIDGRARAACLRHATGRLAEGGLIVFDNSARARYRAAIAASGLEAVRLPGRAPALPYPDETTLLRRPITRTGR